MRGASSKLAVTYYELFPPHNLTLVSFSNQHFFSISKSQHTVTMAACIFCRIIKGKSRTVHGEQSMWQATYRVEQCPCFNPLRCHIYLIVYTFFIFLTDHILCRRDPFFEALRERKDAGFPRRWPYQQGSRCMFSHFSPAYGKRLTLWDSACHSQVSRCQAR